MTTHDHERLERLLDRWDAGRRAARPVPAADLCAEAPDLRDLFALRVRLIEWAERHDGGGESVAPSVLETALAEATSAPADPDWLAPGETADGLELVRLLGRGGMGEVWEANDTRLLRRVAVKFLHRGMAENAAARRRFAREARACAAVQHDNVVAVYNVGEHRGRPYLVMPLLEGETLAARLRRDGPLSADELARVGRAVATGLAALHAHGLTHRDIKPANIWLGADGTVKLLDLGLAHAHAAEPDEEPLGRFGVLLGTPAYMAPEQAGVEGVTPASDLFSLGIVLYQSATGVHPFLRPTVMATLTAIIAHTPLPPSAHRPHLSRGFDELALGLLSKRPDARRPNHAAGVAERLATLTVRPSEPREENRPRWPLAVAAMGAAVALGTLIWLLWLAPVPPPPPPNPDEQVRAVAKRLTDQAVERLIVDETTNGLWKNKRRNEHTFHGTTGQPTYGLVRDGTVGMKVPYSGRYERRSWDLFVVKGLIPPVPETQSVNGVVSVVLAVGPDRVRLADYALTETAGQVTDPGHNAHKTAKEAVLTLLREALPE